MDFDEFWTLVEHHGRVAYYYKNECEDLWRTLTQETQKAVCDAIRTKLQTGRFVHFIPVYAIRDNLPKPPRIQTLSFNDYYKTYGTTEERDGWKMTNPTGEKVIYVKN